MRKKNAKLKQGKNESRGHNCIGVQHRDTRQSSVTGGQMDWHERIYTYLRRVVVAAVGVAIGLGSQCGLCVN